ncbi:hypothetical protein PIB30_000179 [Stylosanthes scabra]|uniref:Transcription factor CBF/NF-Y/archaeal histone domain-containing protein n=1 Tax=Stylosanthes scabra TaxID=79078 RepID=A0ABU6S2L0_9FABA|nr:hypothetical protein [Stylosanthes scabra]
MDEIGGSSSAEGGMKEQDRFVPIANVGRIMKQILPQNAKVSKEAKETMQECVSEFISFVTSEASDKCRKERRKTVNGDDVCWALASLGFDDYALPIRRYLQRYRELDDDEQKPEAETSKLLYIQYKKAIEDYITSKVLPSLRGKKDEVLLRELLRRWSNHKNMTFWLLRFFGYLDRYYLPRFGHHSIEETSLLSFFDLVFDDEMNQQVGDAILSMIDRERAGEKVDWELINNIVAIHSQIGDRSTKSYTQGFVERLVKDNAAFYSDAVSNWIATSSFKFNTPKEEKLEDENPIVSSKRIIKLVSSDGDVFEVEYEVALVSQTIEDLIKADPAAASDEIPISAVKSKTLKKVIEYCKKHSEYESASSSSLEEWDAEFLKVDQPEKLFDLVLASNYLNIESLLNLTTNQIGNMMKGKSPSEIRKIFNIKEELSTQEQEIENRYNNHALQ